MKYVLESFIIYYKCLFIYKIVVLNGICKFRKTDIRFKNTLLVPDDKFVITVDVRATLFPLMKNKMINAMTASED